jgi:hypothetical protein
MISIPSAPDGGLDGIQQRAQRLEDLFAVRENFRLHSKNPMQIIEPGNQSLYFSIVPTH